MKTYSKKSAFSLIELSIVLIIIGLLVAGITGGASLIKSATLRAIMTDARNYNTAVKSFYVSYNAYPGDYNVDFATGIASGFKGDNDGRMEFNTTATTTNAITTAEGYGAIAMLSSTKMITNELSTINGFPISTSFATVIAGSAGKTIPQSKVKGNGWVFDYFSSAIGPTSAPVAVVAVGNATGWANDPQNVVMLTSGYTTSSIATLQDATTNGSMNAEDAKAIDIKLDDGVATAGKVRAFGKKSTVDCLTIVATVVTYNDSGIGSAKNNECVLTNAVDVNS